jgi:ABC-type Fe3+-hydroxamate transport system substrate-binding protein
MRNLAFVTLLAATPALGQEIVVTDASGVEHRFDAPRGRAFCGPMECLAALAGLGLRPYAVWGDWYSDPETGALVHYWGEDADEVLVVPDTGDLEPVAEAAPDLIVTYEYEREARELIAPLYAMHYDLADPIAQGRADMAGLAAILGVPAEAAEARIAALAARVEAYTALSPKDRNVMILMGIGGSLEPGQFYVMGSACAFLARVAPCPDGAPADYGAIIGTEGLLTLDPDLLLLEQEVESDEYDRRATEALAALGTDPLWTEIAAVRDANLQTMPMVLRPTHLTSAAQWLDRYMPLIYPDTFPTPLTDDQVAAALGE